MTIIDFDHLKVTTMTVIVKLKGYTNIENAFPLLDITRLDLPPQIRHTKKYKIPYCGIPGAILSAKFQDITRGIIKSKSKHSFLNSITIDICTSKKNISAKLSGEIIHMCGPDSEELAVETARHIINHLHKLQEELNYINENIIKRDEAIQWIKDNTIGNDYIIDSETQEILQLEEDEKISEENNIIKSDGKIKLKEHENIFNMWHKGDCVMDNKIICDINKNPYIILTSKGERQQAILDVNFFINNYDINNDGDGEFYYQDIDQNPIVIVTKHPIEILRVKNIIIPESYPDSYPDNINTRIINFYFKYAPDFAYYHVYCQFLDSVADIKNIATPDLDIEKVNMAMINYSYSLGMSIDRWELANNIGGKYGFIARYNNSTDHCVTISLPYKIIKKKTKCHTFMVYKSGIVTQSGPSIDTMYDAYYLFMNTIMEIRQYIIQNDKSFNLKYKPTRKVLIDVY